MLSARDLAGMRDTHAEALPDLILSIKRSSGTTSATGARNSGADSIVASNVPCRISPGQMYVTLGELARPLDVDRYTIRVPRGTNVKKRDTLTFPDGSIMEVERVKRPKSWETIMTLEADITV